MRLTEVDPSNRSSRLACVLGKFGQIPLDQADDIVETSVLDGRQLGRDWGRTPFDLFRQLAASGPDDPGQLAYHVPPVTSAVQTIDDLQAPAQI
jgi:hypothetical protein